jgi:hypothetical protein
MRTFFGCFTVGMVSLATWACSSTDGAPPASGTGAGGAAGSGAVAGSGGGSGIGGAPGTGGAGTTGGAPGATGGASGGTGGADTVDDGGAAAGGSSGAAGASTGTADVSIVRVATWKHDAKAAYNIIHDDACDSTTKGQWDHRQELISRKLRAGYGIIVGECDDADYGILKELMAAGHEMINHSYTHVHLPGANNMHEIDEATDVLKKQLGVPITFFIFPYDDFNDALFGRLKDIAYLGARGGEYGGLNDPDVDTSDPLADFRISFDVYQGSGMGSLNSYVDKAIAQGAWANRELHGISDGSWGKINLSDYTTHLDYVVKQVEARKLWMDTPSTVLRYRRSRKHCGTPTASDGVVRFPSPDATCQLYATPLSVVVTSSAGNLTARQGGKNIPVESLGGGQFIIDVDPAAGDAVVDNE